jgi:hypothetical protein
MWSTHLHRETCGVRDYSINGRGAGDCPITVHMTFGRSKI